MNKVDDKSIDFTQLSFDEIESDSIEAADFEFENLHSIIAGSENQQRKSSLIVKLEADLTHGFMVSEYATYKENRWVLKKAENSGDLSVNFNSDVAGGNELKKMLVYHLIPQFHPLGRIRSFVSTTVYAKAFHYIEEYLLLPNGLDATPESIRVISTRLINEALDRSRNLGGPYRLLYVILTFWVMLSEQSLIPESHRLDVPLRLIDTKERQKDIWDVIAASHIGWSPFNEEELSKLIEYALFWTEKAIPVLFTIRDFLNVNGILDQKSSKLSRSKQFLEFESVVGQKIDGVTVCGFSQNKGKTTIRRKNGKVSEYPSYDYWWIRKFREAVDQVRNGILILVALITGMRISELCLLTFDDISQRDDGVWNIEVTRFKTSSDPNFFGDCETIPLPTFIGEMIMEYKKLRGVRDFMRKGLLFEQVANSRKAGIMKVAMQRALKIISRAVGVDAVHAHKFRKTIAEILINRNERNIDLIRMLFGHRSYTMTLRYIARNPYLVHSIAETMETHYAEAFVEIVAAVRNGVYSGAAAERIAKSTSTRPELFKGRLLRMTVYNYIVYLMEAGEPVFIQRTGMGTFCMSSSSYSQNNPPPCVGKSVIMEGNIVPNPTNCQLECQNAIVLEGARETLQKNVSFYSKLLVQTSGSLTKAAQKQLSAKLDINEKHLAALALKNKAQAVDETKWVS